MCWKLITLTPDRITAVCDLCKADLVYNKRSTTNRLRHLRLRHPFEFAAYEEKQLRPVSMRETPFTTTCTPDLHLKTHGPVVEPIAGVSESIKSFEPVHLPNPPVASTSSSACATKQLTIAAAVERAIEYKAVRSRKRRIGACIIKLVTTDVQPLTVVENRSSKQRL